MDFGSEFNIIKESKTKRHRRLNLIEQPGYLVRVHADPCGVGGSFEEFWTKEEAQARFDELEQSGEV